MEKTPSQILNEAADLLTEEGLWNKGYFFKPAQTSKGCSMCAHGAIAYCGNRELREEVSGASSEHVISGANHKAGQGAFQDAQNAVSPYGGTHLAARIKDNNLGLAHYAAMKAGLTIVFNDAHGTTKEQVIQKLRTAAIETDRSAM